MSDIEWYFPEAIEDVPPLLGKEGVIPHGGGTGILRTRMRNVRGLIDLGALPLRFARREGRSVELGAALTFGETAEFFGTGHILRRSLGSAASTPLRNRITLGGSAALFPAWSDLAGPLVALDAEVSLVGETEGTYPVSRYFAEPGLRRRTLVTGLSFRERRWLSAYYRETRTRFDYSAFTLTILLEMDGGRVSDARVVVVGCVGKVARLQKLEDALKGRSVEDAGSIPFPSVSFTQKRFTSPEYLSRVARVELERGIDGILQDRERRPPR